MDSVMYEQINEIIPGNVQYSIGELAKMLSCNKSLLRYYEEQFSLDIPRNEANRRYYTPVEAEKFRYILRLKENGLSNTEIKSVLESERIKKAEYSATAEQKEYPAVQTPAESGISALYEIIAGLRDEINELKSSAIMKDKSELVEENERLRQRLKEKTYELVSLRENTRLNTKKKRFFR